MLLLLVFSSSFDVIHIQSLLGLSAILPRRHIVDMAVFVYYMQYLVCLPNLRFRGEFSFFFRHLLLPLCAHCFVFRFFVVVRFFQTLFSRRLGHEFHVTGIIGMVR